MTAWAIAARSPPGLSRPARPRTRASAARASAGSSIMVARAMISTLAWRSTPVRNASLVPGSFTSRAWARSSIASAALRVSASAQRTSSPANSSQPSGIRAWPSSVQPGAGRRRMNSATAACLRKHADASARSRAQISPTISSSVAPPSRSSSSATRSANPSSADPPGAISRGCPAPNPPAELSDQPGTRRADPGCPGPRRPRVLASAAASAARSSRRSGFPASAASEAASSSVSATIAATSRSQGIAGCSGSSYSSSRPNGSS